MIKVSCDYCDTGLMRHASGIKRQSHQFCNQTCYKQWMLERDPSTRARTVTMQCEICEQMFTVPQYLTTGKYPRRVCDKECGRELRRRTTGSLHVLYKEKIAFQCEVCDKSVFVKPGFLARRRFCSIDCRTRYAAEHHLFVSSIELIVAAELDDRNIDYEQQAIIGGWVPDFLIGNTIIEVDGDYWHNRLDVKKRDRMKTATYLQLGYHLIRIWEHEVNAGDFSKLDVLVA